jgi:predicted metal-dependent phosphotriesterase family hydrolase
MIDSAANGVEPFVRTILGDVLPGILGTVNYHEHLFQASPLLAGDELDDEAKSQDEAELLRDAGTMTMVEATPIGLGRNVAAIARISNRLGLHVIHVTGAHHGGHYREGDPILDAAEDALAMRFTGEVVDGFPDAPTSGGTAYRAGVIKAGIRYWSIPAFERRVLSAVASAHRATGAPVMVHLEHGSAAHEVLDLLRDDGVAEDAVVLAHMDRNLDSGLHGSLAERGAYLGYDGAARHREAPDSAILDCLSAVASSGAGASRVVLGGDVARASRYRSYGGLPGLDYLARRFVPRIRDAMGDAVVREITIENPARWLTFRAR